MLPSTATRPEINTRPRLLFCGQRGILPPSPGHGRWIKTTPNVGGNCMAKRLVMTLLTLGCLLTGARLGWAQADIGSAGPGYGGGIGGLDAGNAANMGGNLNPGIVGGESMPGAILVKITGEVQCLGCTLEEMGCEETP